MSVSHAEADVDVNVDVDAGPEFGIGTAIGCEELRVVRHSIYCAYAKWH